MSGGGEGQKASPNLRGSWEVQVDWGEGVVRGAKKGDVATDHPLPQSPLQGPRKRLMQWCGETQASKSPFFPRSLLSTALSDPKKMPVSAFGPLGASMWS